MLKTKLRFSAKIQLRKSILFWNIKSMILLIIIFSAKIQICKSILFWNIKSIIILIIIFSAKIQVYISIWQNSNLELGDRIWIRRGLICRSFLYQSAWTSWRILWVDLRSLRIDFGLGFAVLNCGEFSYQVDWVDPIAELNPLWSARCT